jgi:hypothetical protein
VPKQGSKLVNFVNAFTDQAQTNQVFPYGNPLGLSRELSVEKGTYILIASVSQVIGLPP